MGRRVANAEKLMLRWQGPYEIATVPSPLIRGVRLLGKPDGDITEVHVSRIRRFADDKLHVTDEFIEFAKHDSCDFEVQEIVGHRYDDTSLELLMHWLGFGEEDRSYEPVESLLDNANRYLRTAIRRYLRSAVLDDPALSKFLEGLEPELNRKRKPTKAQRKKQKEK